jgi:hypothetical protein
MLYGLQRSFQMKVTTCLTQCNVTLSDLQLPTTDTSYQDLPQNSTLHTAYYSFRIITVAERKEFPAFMQPEISNLAHSSWPNHYLNLDKVCQI